ncbi:oligosaccharide flippase family protein [soil metagenome]
MSEARSIVQQGRVYALANIVSRAAGIALLPIFTHVLSPAEFGLYAILQSTVEVLSVLCGLGLTGAMNRFYLEYPDDEAMRDRVVSTVLILVLGMAAAITLLSSLLGPLLAHAVLGNSNQAVLCIVALIGLGCIALFEVECAYAVVRKQVGLFLALSVAKAVSLIGFSLLFVVELRLGVLGALLATTVSMGLIGAITLVLLLRRTGLHFIPSLALRLMRFGAPLVPSAFGNSALGLVERYYLNSAASAAAVGLYSLAGRLASLLQMFIAAPFSQTYSVRRVETLVKGEAQSPYDRLLLLFVLTMSMSSFALSIFAADLIAVIAPGSYALAAQLVPLLGLCATLASVNFNLELGIHYSKQTWALPITAAVALAASLPLNWWLSLQYGALGTAIALVAVNVVRLLMTLMLNARVGSREVALDWPRAIGIMVSTLIAALLWLGFHLPALDPAWMLAKAVLVVIVGAAIIASPLLGAAARADLSGVWRRSPLQAAV